MTEDELRHPKDLPDALTSIAVLCERIHNVEEARDLQAQEYKRRLEELNRADAESETELRQWRTEVDKVVAVVKANRAFYAAAIGITISLASLGLWLFSILNR